MNWAAPSLALVGASENGETFAARTVMLLKRAGTQSGFCTGVVLADDVVLTAGHCVHGASDLAAYIPNGTSSSIIAIDRTILHPEFQADAIRARRRSIDLAIVRLTRPLPSSWTPARLATQTTVTPGESFHIAGYGLTREGDGRSAGKLRSGVIAARPPISAILLWAEDPQKNGFGACTGDSGGPIFSATGSDVVAITVWSRGSGGKSCGELTQGVLVAPQRQWIGNALQQLRR